MLSNQSMAMSSLVLRLALGVVFVAHGYNHVRGGAGIAGTARWFHSIGMRPGVVHAWLASATEFGAGCLILTGLAVPFGCAGVVGTMTVAWITNHRKHGFFIFRPGEGYEYVMTLLFVALALGGLGSGAWSLDNALAVPTVSGWWGILVAGGGAAGAAVLLVLCWRPDPLDRV